MKVSHYIYVIMILTAITTGNKLTYKEKLHGMHPIPLKHIPESLAGMLIVVIKHEANIVFSQHPCNSCWFLILLSG